MLHFIGPTLSEIAMLGVNFLLARNEKVPCLALYNQTLHDSWCKEANITLFRVAC